LLDLLVDLEGSQTLAMHPLKCAYRISRQDTIVPGQELPTNFGTDLPWLIGGRGQITLDLYHSTCADLAMFLGLKISEGFWKGGFTYLSIGVLPIPIYPHTGARDGCATSCRGRL